ncbi:hypothetical protein, partial [Burkholderia dolosa]|uniref:hypothetical protein n=1 Tax=Burkholderia dolosa TaxID=152500 RepID=UPI001B92E1A6
TKRLGLMARREALPHVAGSRSPLPDSLARRVDGEPPSKHRESAGNDRAPALAHVKRDFLMSVDIAASRGSQVVRYSPVTPLQSHSE